MQLALGRQNCSYLHFQRQRLSSTIRKVVIDMILAQLVFIGCLQAFVVSDHLLLEKCDPVADAGILKKDVFQIRSTPKLELTANLFCDKDGKWYIYTCTAGGKTWDSGPFGDGVQNIDGISIYCSTQQSPGIDITYGADDMILTGCEVGFLNRHKFKTITVTAMPDTKVTVNLECKEKLPAKNAPKENKRLKGVTVTKEMVYFPVSCKINKRKKFAVGTSDTFNGVTIMCRNYVMPTYGDWVPKEAAD